MINFHLKFENELFLKFCVYNKIQKVKIKSILQLKIKSGSKRLTVLVKLNFYKLIFSGLDNSLTGNKLLKTQKYRKYIFLVWLRERQKF